ncbi:MAG TPA: hypothetical protein VIM16_22185 [Mucilaginibacter sp.]
MNRRVLTLIFCVFNVWSCNIFSIESLEGKKLYFLYKKETTIYGISIPVYVEELEFYFVTKDEVQVVPTVFYGIGAEYANKSLKLNYTYKDDYLTISGINAGSVKLTESDNFYSTDAGETYYKNSILELSQEQKRDRIKKTLISTSLNIDSNFLQKETVFHN